MRSESFIAGGLLVIGLALMVSMKLVAAVVGAILVILGLDVVKATCAR